MDARRLKDIEQYTTVGIVRSHQDLATTCVEVPARAACRTESEHRSRIMSACSLSPEGRSADSRRPDSLVLDLAD